MSPMLQTMLSFAIACLLFASWKGGKPERYAVIVYLLWLVAGPVYQLLGDPQFNRLDVVNMVIDALLAVGLIWIALRANRIWPLFAAALSIIPMLGHLAMALEMPGIPRAYWSMTESPSLAIATSLALGALFHSRRMAIHGRYRDWRLT